MKKIQWIFVALLIFLGIPQIVFATGTHTIYGPATFSRSTGKPVVQNITVVSPFPDQEAQIIIVNGDVGGKDRLSSATLIFNGAQIAGPSDFNNQTGPIEKTIPVGLTNTFSVKTAGTPGDFIKITIKGTPPPPVINIIRPLDQEYVFQPSIMVHGNVDTYADNISVSVNGKRANVNDHEFILSSLLLNPGANTINVQTVDSFRNQDQATITVFKEYDTTAEWIELQPKEPAFFQPMTIKMKVVSHLQHNANFNTAELIYKGPGTGIISSISPDEYSMNFDTPGIYTLNYSVNDVQGNLFKTSAILSVMEPFNEDDWLAMNDATKDLENIYLAGVGSTDIATLRQQILESAQTNQDYSSVALSGGALSLVYKGMIPVILDLPDPDSPATEGSNGGNKKSPPPSTKAFNKEHFNKLLKTKRCKKCDLEGANLEGADLEHASLAWAKLKGANLKNANLRGAIIAKANLEGANLSNADCSHANLHESNLSSANLQKANLESAKLNKANLQDSNLQDAVLKTTRLKGANLQGADLRNANLDWAKMEGANLRGVKLQGASMKNTFLYQALLDKKGRKYAEKNGAQFTKDTRIEND